MSVPEPHTSALSTQHAEEPVPDLDDPRVLAALEEYQAAVDRGQRPDRRTFLEKHKVLAPALRACLEGLDLVRSAASDLQTGPVMSTAIPAVLGDFRVLRPIGRGGMGIVYQAEQISLKRSVALKVLPTASALDSRQRQRFRIETEAAALLQHPHVVPIYAVGSEAGISYYAMQLIEGPTLAEVITLTRNRPPVERENATTRTMAAPGVTAQAGVTADERPVSAFGLSTEALQLLGIIQGRRISAHSAARLILQAAEGLHHAHEHGVLHRDIKPSNLLLDARGKVWIADFGLAQLPGNVRITRTGDIVGTLRYLSPEKACGLPADHRADIYALGVTLYELLTLRPPFESEDRHQLFRQIAETEPRSVRSLAPWVPRDLETIVLKAMAKEPSGRYPTAEAFAEDLRRFLEGRPVQARRLGLFDRATRWANRHRSLVATAMAGILLAIAGLGYGLVREGRMRQREAAMAGRWREVVDSLYSQVAEKWLGQQAHLEPIQREILEKVLVSYEDFLERWKEDADVRFEAARAARRVGDIRSRLGRSGAVEAYQQALTLLQGLRDGESGVRHEQAVCLSHLGHALGQAQRVAEAEVAQTQARHEFASLVKEFPSNPELLNGLAGATTNLGILLQRASREEEAEQLLRDALEIQRRLCLDHPQVPAYEHDLGAALNNLAVLRLARGDRSEALCLLNEALQRQTNLLARHPTEPLYREGHGTTHQALAQLHRAQGRLTEARTALEEAGALRARLAHDFPSVPAYRRSLAETLHELGHFLAQRGSREEAITALNRALTLRLELARAHSNETLPATEAAATARLLEEVTAGRVH